MPFASFLHKLANQDVEPAQYSLSEHSGKAWRQQTGKEKALGAEFHLNRASDSLSY